MAVLSCHHIMYLRGILQQFIAGLIVWLFCRKKKLRIQNVPFYAFTGFNILIFSYIPYLLLRALLERVYVSPTIKNVLFGEMRYTLALERTTKCKLLKAELVDCW